MPKYQIGQLVAYKTREGGLFVGTVRYYWPNHKGGFIYRVQIDTVHFFRVLEDALIPVPLDYPTFFKK